MDFWSEAFHLDGAAGFRAPLTHGSASMTGAAVRLLPREAKVGRRNRGTEGKPARRRSGVARSGKRSNCPSQEINAVDSTQKQMNQALSAACTS